MRKILVTIGVVLLIGALLLTGCTKPVEGVAVGEPNPAAGTSPKIGEDAAKAMEFAKTIGNIKAITLKDLEGNVLDRVFSTEEMAAIQTAFNESFIMDTAYIEMIAGNTMTIDLEDGREVFIHSYGDPGYIVARIGDDSFHLGCEVIGKILLEEVK